MVEGEGVNGNISSLWSIPDERMEATFENLIRLCRFEFPDTEDGCRCRAGCLGAFKGMERYRLRTYNYRGEEFFGRYIQSCRGMLIYGGERRSGKTLFAQCWNVWNGGSGSWIPAWAGGVWNGNSNKPVMVGCDMRTRLYEKGRGVGELLKFLEEHSENVMFLDDFGGELVIYPGAGKDRKPSQQALSILRTVVSARHAAYKEHGVPTWVILPSNTGYEELRSALGEMYWDKLADFVDPLDWHGMPDRSAGNGDAFFRSRNWNEGDYKQTFLGLSKERGIVRRREPVDAGF